MKSAWRWSVQRLRGTFDFCVGAAAETARLPRDGRGKSEDVVCEAAVLVGQQLHSADSLE